MKRYRVTVDGTPYHFDLAELAEEARREYEMRKGFYQRLVTEKRLSPEEAELRIAKMKAIWKLLQRQAEAESAGQESLFSVEATDEKST